jgi:positive regulator of sigma E activity
MNLIQKNNSSFVHSGFVSKINGDSIVVTLEQDIHCESCRAKASCGMSESNTKEVEIINADNSFRINEEVQVVLNKTLGIKAVFWAYIFPFIFMFFTLIITSGFFEEWIAGIASLLVLLPYYSMLYFLKNTFKSAFKISILKT